MNRNPSNFYKKIKNKKNKKNKHRYEIHKTCFKL